MREELQRPHAGVALAAMVLAVSQCHGMQLIAADGLGYSVPVTSLQQSRFHRVRHQQHDFSCGSAAVASLLSFHYGDRVSEDSAFEAMYASGDTAKIRREGFSMLDMKRFLAARGYQADGFEVGLDQLAQAGLPAIALIDDEGYQHFVIIKGLRDGRVLIGDPSRGARTLSRREFDRLWRQRVLFVVHDHREQAAFNLPADWRAAPLAPVHAGIDRSGAAELWLRRPGPGDF
jgi:predicted double-glycine peptidase